MLAYIEDHKVQVVMLMTPNHKSPDDDDGKVKQNDTRTFALPNGSSLCALWQLRFGLAISALFRRISDLHASTLKNYK